MRSRTQTQTEELELSSSYLVAIPPGEEEQAGTEMGPTCPRVPGEEGSAAGLFRLFHFCFDVPSFVPRLRRKCLVPNFNLIQARRLMAILLESSVPPPLSSAVFSA